LTSFFLGFNRAACDTDNNKLHNEKTPQLTKGQRYDRLNRKSTFQTLWKENRLHNPMLTILKEAINVGLKLYSTSVTQTFNLLFNSSP
jgi:hypothetical protein